MNSQRIPNGYLFSRTFHNTSSLCFLMKNLEHFIRVSLQIIIRVPRLSYRSTLAGDPLRIVSYPSHSLQTVRVLSYTQGGGIEPPSSYPSAARLVVIQRACGITSIFSTKPGCRNRYQVGRIPSRSKAMDKKFTAPPTK